MLDLTDDVKKPDFGWDDYYAPAQAATHGRRQGAGAAGADRRPRGGLQQEGVQGRRRATSPAEGWTWDDFAATSKALTDKSKGTFGTAWPAVGDEDTVWRIWPPVWQAGGDVITEDGKVGFGGAPGEQAFGVVDRLAQDGSVYVDTKPDSDQTYQLFNNGKIGYVTHDQVEAMTLGQRVAVLRDGVLQQFGDPQELFHRPVNLFVAPSSARRP